MIYQLLGSELLDKANVSLQVYSRLLVQSYISHLVAVVSHFSIAVAIGMGMHSYISVHWLFAIHHFVTFCVKLSAEATIIGLVHISDMLVGIVGIIK